jgi:uncharacterized protein (TIGR02996 family)
MAVYFVFRSHDGTPTEKHVRRFEYDTVLEWAKAVWKLHDARQEARRYAEQLFGEIDVEVFCGLFHKGEDAATTRPRTMADVQGWFFDQLYCEEEAHGGHHLQVLTEWGDDQRAIYVFDDHYRNKKPGKTDFLLLDGWELPAGESNAPAPKLPPTKVVESGGGDGKLYIVWKYADSKYHLDDLDRPEHISGLRVPDLARYVLLYPDPDEIAYPLHKVRDGLLEVLNRTRGEDAGFRAAIRKHPDDLTSWSAYSDWLEDRDLPPAGLHLLERALQAEQSAYEVQNRKPKLDLVKVTPHMAQVCKHAGCSKKGRKTELSATDTFAQFTFFDDRWAAAHPALAAGAITFVTKWDVLT